MERREGRDEWERSRNGMTETRASRRKTRETQQSTGRLGIDSDRLKPSRLIDDLMEWRNVVIARPGSPVTSRG